LAINGYNEEEWSQAISYGEAAARISEFATDGILAAWNITFEYGFLDQMFRDTRVINRMDYHRIDLPSIAWMLIPNLPNPRLDLVGAYFGLAPEQKPHTGIRGAEYELEVLRRLKRRLEDQRGSAIL
jgi:DNA polymerase III alpha subunit (gram-positive type)